MELFETVKIKKNSVKVYGGPEGIILESAGLRIVFPVKPNAPCLVERGEGRASALPDDPSAMADLQEIGEEWRAKDRRRIRAQWGTRCFSADEQGLWHHPVTAEAAKMFRCGICGHSFKGKNAAANMWHCPDPECAGAPQSLTAE